MQTGCLYCGHHHTPSRKVEKVIAAETAVELFRKLEPYGDRTVFLQIGASLSAARSRSVNVSGIGAVFLDVDVLTDDKADRNKRLPGSKESALELLRQFPIPPSIFVDSGRGLHVYWLLDKWLDTTTDEGRSLAERVQRQLHAFACRAMNADLDQVGDLARCMRLPGTNNFKTNPPSSCEVLLCSSYERYSVEQLLDAFPAPEVVEDAKGVAAPSAKATVQHATLAKLMDEAEAQWRSKRKAQSTYDKLNFKSIYLGCGHIRHLVDHPASQSYDDWRNFCTIAAKCEDGLSIFLAASKGYPGFDEGQAVRMFWDSEKVIKPACFEGHRSHRCVRCDQLSTPAEYGHWESTFVIAARRYAFVGGSNRFVDLTTFDSISIEGLSNLYRGSVIARGRFADALLNAPFCPKATRQVYQPGLAPGVVYLDGEFVLNRFPGLHDWPINHDKPEEFLRLIEFLAGDQKDALLDCIASALQNPSRKIKHAILIQSGQGVGKDTLASIIERLLGKQNVRRIDGQALAGHFKASLYETVVLVGNELALSDKRQTYNEIKTLISEEYGIAEEKYEKGRNLMTPRLILLFSNHEVSLKIEANDRRFLVIRGPDERHPDGDEFYNRLNQLSDDDIAKIATFLKSRSLARFNPSAPPPMTEAKRDLIAASMSQLARTMKECMDNRDAPFHRAAVLLDDVREAFPDRFNNEPTSNEAAEALKSCGAFKYRKQVRMGDGPAKTIYVMPWARELRDKDHEIVRKVVKGTIESDPDEWA